MKYEKDEGLLSFLVEIPLRISNTGWINRKDTKFKSNHFAFASTVETTTLRPQT